MEKIKIRDFRLFWMPQVVVALAALLTVMFIWIPLIGIAVSLVASLAIAAAGVFSMIYRLYFYYQLSMDVNAVCEGDGLETPGFLFVAALHMITFGLYSKFWIYKLGQRLQANAPRYGFKMVIGGKELVILDILSAGWISAWEFVRNMNQFAKEYNRTIGAQEMVGGVQ